MGIDDRLKFIDYPCEFLGPLFPYLMDSDDSLESMVGS